MTNKVDEQITYNIDDASPDGDYVGLSIKYNDMLFTFVGLEAELIISLITQEKTALLDRVLEQVPDASDYDNPYDVEGNMRQALQQIKEKL